MTPLQKFAKRIDAYVEEHQDSQPDSKEYLNISYEYLIQCATELSEISESNSRDKITLGIIRDLLKL